MYVTVEPTTKQDKLLAARMANFGAVIILLFLDHYGGIKSPESLYIIFGSAGAGLEIGQLINLIKRK